MMGKEVVIARTAAAKEALAFLDDAHVVGLGTGSTTSLFIEIAEQEGKLKGKELVVSSIDTGLKLRRKGYSVMDTVFVDELDVYIDSADEVDSEGKMVKGGGGALLQEKILSRISRKSVFIVDWKKLVPRLGVTHPIPIEITPKALSWIVRHLESSGYRVTIRVSGGKKGPVVSDSGGILLDLYPPEGKDIEEVNEELIHVPGVVETGLFLKEADLIIVGYPEGKTERISRKSNQ